MIDVTQAVDSDRHRLGHWLKMAEMDLDRAKQDLAETQTRLRILEQRVTIEQTRVDQLRAQVHALAETERR